VSDLQPTAVELEKARLGEALPGWRIWTVDMTVGGTSWHAMPAGAETAVCDAYGAAELLDACREWNVDAYIKKTEAELAAVPAVLLERLRTFEMLSANLAAARMLCEAQEAASQPSDA
jgi:hypothetical protein